MAHYEVLGMDKDEKVIKEIRRHPVGLLGIYLFGAVTVVGVAAVASWLSMADIEVFDEISTMAWLFVTGLLIALILVVTYIASSIYRANKLIITTENLVQISQTGLFSRHVSQFNLSKIQDVTVTQNGIMPTVLNYGSILIETAGETANYGFQFAPNPRRVAMLIIEAHEAYVERLGANPSDY